MNGTYIVFCLKSGGHYNFEETYPVKVIIEGPLQEKKLHICHTCYEALPETDKVRKLDSIK